MSHVMSLSSQHRSWPVLKPVGPEQDPRLIRVNRLSCVAGARARVHLPLNSPMVSRAHALIIIDQDEVYIRDLASRNGLLINGAPARETALRIADLVRIGPFIFNCQSGFPEEEDRQTSGQGDKQTSGQEEGDLEYAPAKLVMGDPHRFIALDGRTFLLGRRADCDLQLNHRFVSRVHAVIFRRNGRRYIRDLNSKNGTLVNGQRIREFQLQDGDEVQVGGILARYEAPQEVEYAAVGLAGSASAALSSVSGSSAASGSMGAQTSDATEQEEGSSGPVGPATSEDFDFSSEVSLAPVSAPDELTEPASATSADLFPTELSLAPGLLDSVSDNGDEPSHNGEHSGDDHSDAEHMAQEHGASEHNGDGMMDPHVN